MKNDKIWSSLPIVFVTALFCCLLWGSATPAIKIAYDLFSIGAEDTGSRIMLAGARFMLAGVMTVSFGSALSGKILIPSKASLKYILVLALFQTIGQYYFFFMSLAHTSGVRGSVINASGNFFAILLAAYAFKFEKMTFKKIAGCIIGFIGIILILGGSRIITDTEQFSLAGEGAMLLAALFYALSGCCIKIFSKRENPVILSGYQFALGGLVLFTIGLLMGGQLIFSSSTCWLNLIYMGFISAGAYTLWGILLKHNPVSRVSIFGFMNPVLGVVLSALFLGEVKDAFSLSSIMALVLVALGIIIVNMESS